MENHPIPQDVTGFKFKLIGSVTVKQFLYILGGGILAVVTFMLPINIIIRLPFSIIFGGIGAALAFIPIEGRPMDIMIKNFLKALPSENRYIFKKKGAEALIAEFFTPRITVAQQALAINSSPLDERRALLYNTLKMSSSYRPDEKERAVLSNITSYFNETTQTPKNTPIRADELPVQNKATQIVRPIPAPKLPETPVRVVTPPPQKVETAPVETPTPVATPAPVAVPVQTVPQMPAVEAKVIAPDTQLKAGFPQIPDTPNVVMGIVKDPRGRVLPNILVEIMDPQQTPVRAFKTNALGQFAAATPLPDGEYNVLLEDPKRANEFEPLRITLSGKIFQPLEIISTDQREKLRRELFGVPNTPAQV